MSAGTRREFRYIQEEAFAVTPAAATFKVLRNTGGAGVSVARSTLATKEFRQDRALPALRLGTNQGKLPVPFDLSYQSFDDLIEAALMGQWLNATGQNTVVIGAVSVTYASAGKTFTRASGSWISDGFAVGDRVRFNNLVTNAAYNGTWFLITTLTATVMTLGNAPAAIVNETVATALSYDRKGGLPIQFPVQTIAVATGSPATYTRSAGSWITDGVAVGDYVTFGGFTNGGNNGQFKVTAVSALVVSVTNAGAVVEGASAGRWYWDNTMTLKDGTALTSFSIEDAQTDISVFQLIAGALVNGFTLSIKANALASGTFDIVAGKSGGVGATTNTGGTTAAPTTIPFDTFTGSILEGGSSIAIASGIDLNLQNGFDLKYAIFNQNAFTAAASAVNLTGTLTVFFSDSSLLNKFLAETETSVAFTLTDLTGNSYTITLPRIKYTATTKNVSEKDVSVALTFTALKDLVTTLCHISIVKKAA